MNSTICDVCGRVGEYCKYSRRKRLGWFRHDYDSQGGSEMLLDLCEDCFHGFQSFMQNRLARKEKESK